MLLTESQEGSEDAGELHSGCGGGGLFGEVEESVFDWR